VRVSINTLRSLGAGSYTLVTQDTSGTSSDTGGLKAVVGGGTASAITVTPSSSVYAALTGGSLSTSTDGTPTPQVR
jgi:NADH:ubiquinone oxidoreductase subunit 2 (subunit N)